MRVGVVVVTYNRLALLKEVVNSIRCQTYMDFDIVVVNNGSTDGTLGWLQDQSDIFVINQDNLGGAGGFFTGIKYVAEHGYDYCWIMDDDVISKHTALQELILAINAQDNIGFVCSRVLGTDEKTPMNTPLPNFSAGANGYIDTYDLVADNAMVRVQNATFVSILFSTSVVYKVGLPIKQYFIWGDDSEYTQRISEYHKCYIACRSIVIHKRELQKSLSLLEENNPNRIRNYYFMYRNHLLSEKIHKHRRAFVLNFIQDAQLAAKLFFKGQILKAKVIFLGIWAAIYMNPKIEWPSKKS